MINYLLIVEPDEKIIIDQYFGKTNLEIHQTYDLKKQLIFIAKSSSLKENFFFKNINFKNYFFFKNEYSQYLILLTEYNQIDLTLVLKEVKEINNLLVENKKVDMNNIFQEIVNLVLNMNMSKNITSEVDIYFKDNLENKMNISDIDTWITRDHESSKNEDDIEKDLLDLFYLEEESKENECAMKSNEFRFLIFFFIASILTFMITVFVYFFLI